MNRSIYNDVKNGILDQFVCTFLKSNSSFLNWNKFKKWNNFIAFEWKSYWQIFFQIKVRIFVRNKNAFIAEG